ncbi:MAG: SSU ribosomal protein S12p (S23e), partial [uncultured Pseudonocardia sp.]
AHDPAAGPQGPTGQGRQAEDACPQGEPAAPRRVHPRVHDHPEEAELRPAQGRPRAALEPGRGHRLHPGRGPQPPGALDRARPRRPGEGPARRPLQDRARCARHPGGQEPQAGPQPLRREEGEL